MNFQGVMVQLAPRVTIRQTNLGIQLRTLTGSSRQVRIVKYGLMHTPDVNQPFHLRAEA